MFLLYALCIGVGRFRILGGQGLEYWGGGGGQGGPNSQQAHDVASRFIKSQCQIIHNYISHLKDLISSKIQE